jgi:gluconokinase
MDTFLAIDLGTSSTRAALYRNGDNTFEQVDGTAYQIQRKRGLNAPLEAETLVRWVRTCVRETITRAPSGTRIQGAGISGFWHSAVGLDERNRPQTPVLLWASGRGAEQVSRLREADAVLPQRTGCPWHTSYLPGRLLWLQETQPDVFARCVRFVSPHGYVLGRLFGFDKLCESPSMASATGLFDQTIQDWLPEWKDRLFPVGNVPLGEDFPWFPAIGDGVASSIGAGAISPERIALMIGTSGALRLFSNRNDPCPALPDGLWRYQLATNWFARGGALTNGGSLWAWLEKRLKLGSLPDAPPCAHGLTVLPFLAGERAPLWRDDLCGTIHGLRDTTTAADIARAHLEAVAYRFRAIREALRPLAPRATLIGTGAALKNNPLWAQMLADVLGEPLQISAENEGSARGAALWACELLGVREIEKIPLPPIQRVFEPDAGRTAIYEKARQRHEELLTTLFPPA